MIGNDPNIDKFIHEYATSVKVRSMTEWGQEYNVDRNTISKWIKEYSTDIEEINREVTSEFSKNLQRIGSEIIDIVGKEINEKRDFDTAIRALPQIMPYISARKEQLDVNARIDKTDEWIVELDKANVAGGQ
jgi:hypothetical protein